MSTATNSEYTYILRTCSWDMTSWDGFKWPRKGPVKCKDWSTEPKCGNGLHGLLMGSGDGLLLNWKVTDQWLVVKILVQDVVAIGQDQVKFPKGTVVYCGDRKGATDYIIAHGADASKVVGACITVGDGDIGCGGDYATVSGGDWAKVSGGDWAKVSGGYGAKVSGGDYATVSGGCRATVIGGGFSKVSGGDFATVSGGGISIVSGGNGATVSGGYRATVSGGNWAEVSGGVGATVSGGYRAKVSGGEGAILQVLWYNGIRYRVAVAYVGEDGIEANVQYKVNNQGKFIKV